MNIVFTVFSFGSATVPIYGLALFRAIISQMIFNSTNTAKLVCRIRNLSNVSISVTLVSSCDVHILSCSIGTLHHKDSYPYSIYLYNISPITGLPSIFSFYPLL